MSEDREWPTDGDLKELMRDSQEHKRAWTLVGGLSRRLLNERQGSDRQPSTEDQNKRIAGLEQKIVKQRHFLAQLEICREFERETERLLKEALEKIAKTRASDAARSTATAALHELAHRKGPRPTEADAEA